MKRSQMLKILRTAFVDHMNDMCDDCGIRGCTTDDQMYSAILKHLEDAGMLPPPAQGIYGTVPTITPTGNLDYSYIRKWEQE